jgi:hypothetical protein
VTEGLIQGLSTTPYPRGVSLYGMARDVMRNIAKSNNATWYINNSKLYHIPTSSQGTASGITLNANTGLIGRPVETEGGIIVTALINPQFNTNTQLVIDQKSINRAAWAQDVGAQNLQQQLHTSDGTYNILAIEWRGDTRGTEWYATMVCKGVTGSIPNSQLNVVGG